MASLELGMRLVGQPQGDKQKTDELLEIFCGMYKRFSDAAKTNKCGKVNYPLQFTHIEAAYKLACIPKKRYIGIKALAWLETLLETADDDP